MGAESTLRKISDVVKMLSENPAAGRLRMDLGADLRSFPSGNYLVFYRVDEMLTIARVVSSTRDITPEMFEH